MTPREWPHWRRRLGEVQDLCLVAHEVDDVARAVLQLVAVLLDDGATRDQETATLRTLVREAGDLLTRPRTRGREITAWLDRARAVLDEPVRDARMDVVAAIDPRD